MKYLTLFLFLSSFPLFGDQIDAEFLLQKVDDSRSPYNSFRESVQIFKIEDNQVTDSNRLEVFYRLNGDGSGASLAVFREPENMEGRITLMSQGMTWLYVPGSSGAIRISLAQRLSGGVSTGDILSINYRKDYDAELTGEDNVHDTPVYILELTAHTQAVTYYQVRLYVDQSTFLPVMAEYSSKTGTVLKSAYYTEYTELNGKSVCTEIRLVDHLNADELTVIRCSDFREEAQPQRFYNPQNLQDLEL